MFEAVRDRITTDKQPGAQVPDGVALDIGRTVWHDYRHRYIHDPTRVGDSLPVISRGRRNHPMPSLYLIQQRHRIHTAPYFEGSDRLMIFIFYV